MAESLCQADARALATPPLPGDEHDELVHGSVSHEQCLGLGLACGEGGIVAEATEEIIQSLVRGTSDRAFFDEPQQKRAAKNLVGRVLFPVEILTACRDEPSQGERTLACVPALVHRRPVLCVVIIWPVNAQQSSPDERQDRGVVHPRGLWRGAAGGSFIGSRDRTAARIVACLRQKTRGRLNGRGGELIGIDVALSNEPVVTPALSRLQGLECD